MSSPQSSEAQRKLALTLAAVGVAAAVLVGAIVVFAVMLGSGPVERSLHDYHVEPTTIRELLADELGEPVRLYWMSIEEGAVETRVDRDGRLERYYIGRSGKVMRRGGATRLGNDVFELGEVDLALVPRVLAEVRSLLSAPPSAVELQRDDAGRIVWRTRHFVGGRWVYVVFEADGTRRTTGAEIEALADQPARSTEVETGAEIEVNPAIER